MELTDVNWFDVDKSPAMFDGKFVKSFPHPSGGDPVSFLFRRIDPGTLLELTDNALYLMVPREESEELDEEELLERGLEPPPEPPPPQSEAELFVSNLRMLKIRTTHRLEVLQRCIVKPIFETLEQVKGIPTDWQLELYGGIMQNVLGGNCLMTGRFPEAGEVKSS